MVRVAFAAWTLEVDAEATRLAYAQMPSGSADRCGCGGCQNFAQLRDQIYPTQVRDLFESLGVDHLKEAEAYHIYRDASGRHLMGWWLHAIGQIVDGDDASVPDGPRGHQLHLLPLTEDFSLGITHRTALVHEPFGGHALIQIECQAYMPWVIEGVEEPE